MPYNEYDALLVLSFGGPEGNDEVLPFLQNVTRGRGIPDERLVEVGKHYYHFDGVSPLNALNREIISNLEAELTRRGTELPVYFGNRNWHPFAEDAAAQMVKDGVRNALVFATSAWAGFSACLQYNEDIRRIRESHPELRLTKLRQFYDHPLFIAEMADAVREAYAEVPEDRRDHTRLLFTAHSVPTDADNRAGGEGGKNLYSRQVAEASRLIAAEVGVADYDLVWQSRSGNPATPWLEPDVVDHTEAIAQSDGVRSVVVCPVGFISDHMEVVWDLDTELQEAADDLDVTVHRTRTAGPSQRFSTMVADLIAEMTDDKPAQGIGQLSVQGCTVNGAACRPGCCSEL
ncbi:ferrochelatase [Corynebacterium doosanense]|uniref:Coproporphyrin III ferrochelatase n=1 Tax=Corynebacterium doosanense CAU 212 = DSM 45436 TaxID=558173 RepID=A0A097IG40_9CORY|nr:ferrochelatase [Corynebacterium doosanense]AIT61108.1 ferrochelatase [Corynebacterium doosanense CAU 212 = DSM 45436]